MNNNMVKFALIRNRSTDRVLLEYALSIIYYLEEAGHEAFMSTFHSENNFDVGIILDCEIEIPEDIDLTKKYVLLNLEQLTRSVYFTFVTNILTKYPSFLYADYSTANIKLIGKGIWIPYLHNPSIKFDRSKIKKNDSVFFGWVNPHRTHICKKYNATILAAWSKERDKIIQESRCQLNIHFREDYKILETLRIYHSIYLGTPVLLIGGSFEEEIYLGKDAQKYMLEKDEIPNDLPNLTFEEEDAKAREIISNFISTCLS